jgi:hypothetical protein
MRRIERRKGIHQLDSTQDYVRFTGELMKFSYFSSYGG